MWLQQKYLKNNILHIHFKKCCDISGFEKWYEEGRQWNQSRPRPANKRKDRKKKEDGRQDKGISL